MNSWKSFIASEQKKDYFKDLLAFLETEKTGGKEIFPPENKVFAAFDLCPLKSLNVVILGQDPYHGPGQAHGLAFSVAEGVAIPPSLRNIRKELSSDLNVAPPEHGNLTHWATQGIFLINTTLTVESGKPLSHAKRGWEEFTDRAIQFISEQRETVVFLLWGNSAHKKEELIDTNKHFVLKAAHPSPLSASRGFLGCRHFSKTNEQLRKWGLLEIKW